VKSKERRPAVRETERNALVLRLERNQKDVDRLRDQLTSYRYEPKTPRSFRAQGGLAGRAGGHDQDKHRNHCFPKGKKEACGFLSGKCQTATCQIHLVARKYGRVRPGRDGNAKGPGTNFVITSGPIGAKTSAKG